MMQPRDSTAIPAQAREFDETMETQARFVQAGNLFVIIIMLYESIKLGYLHFAYEDECSDYARLLIIVVIENILWMVIAIYGANSVVSRDSRKIRSFLRWLLLFLVLRIATYMYMNYYMKQIITNVDDWRCDAVYQGGLYLLNGSLEAALIFLLLVYGNRVKSYVESKPPPLLRQASVGVDARRLGDCWEAESQ